MADKIDGDGGYERHFVLGARSHLAARAVTTQVGVIGLDEAAELMNVVVLCHGAIELLMHQPCRGVAGVAKAQLSLQRQRRQTGLCVTDEVDRENLCSLRQLGVLHQATCRYADIEV